MNQQSDPVEQRLMPILIKLTGECAEPGLCDYCKEYITALREAYEAGRAEGRRWLSPFEFPEKDGKYLIYYEDGYAIGTFHRQDEHVGHWQPSRGIRGWLPLAEPPTEVIRARLVEAPAEPKDFLCGKLDCYELHCGECKQPLSKHDSKCSRYKKD